ncbi:MAG: GNAT family N-acetyltransferase [Oscillospiraceae bacterium]|nr:GNAT family N-acetyltransferase [Oscillospiraceae bacterium]
MVKEVPVKDVERALRLVNAVFSEFVAVDYSEQGQSTFAAYLEGKLDEISADLTSEHKKMWAYYRGDEILGVIATQGTSHISLLFVDKAYHRQGIARQMFEAVLDQLKGCNVTRITVNSSPYAVAVYKRLGFTITQGQQEKDGILYIPMLYTL